MRARRTDANHSDIRDALKAAGASVMDLSGVGRGCGDFLVGFSGLNYLIEAKDGGKSASQRRLTPAQVRFHAGWKGQIATVTTAAEALALLTAADGAGREEA